MPDDNGDEVDGFDEGMKLARLIIFLGYSILTAVIFPVDFRQTGTINDDVSLFTLRSDHVGECADDVVVQDDSIFAG